MRVDLGSELGPRVFHSSFALLAIASFQASQKLPDVDRCHGTSTHEVTSWAIKGFARDHLETVVAVH